MNIIPLSLIVPEFPHQRPSALFLTRSKYCGMKSVAFLIINHLLLLMFWYPDKETVIVSITAVYVRDGTPCHLVRLYVHVLPTCSGIIAFPELPCVVDVVPEPGELDVSFLQLSVRLSAMMQVIAMVRCVTFLLIIN